MIDEADLVLDAVAALGAAGVTVSPIGEEMDRWQIGNLVYTDAEQLRLAESRGLAETP